MACLSGAAVGASVPLGTREVPRKTLTFTLSGASAAASYEPVNKAGTAAGTADASRPAVVTEQGAVRVNLARKAALQDMQITRLGLHNAYVRVDDRDSAPGRDAVAVHLGFPMPFDAPAAHRTLTLTSSAHGYYASVTLPPSSFDIALVTYEKARAGEIPPGDPATTVLVLHPSSAGPLPTAPAHFNAAGAYARVGAVWRAFLPMAAGDGPEALELWPDVCTQRPSGALAIAWTAAVQGALHPTLVTAVAALDPTVPASLDGTHPTLAALATAPATRVYTPPLNPSDMVQVLSEGLRPPPAASVSQVSPISASLTFHPPSDTFHVHVRSRVMDEVRVGDDSHLAMRLGLAGLTVQVSDRGGPFVRRGTAAWGAEEARTLALPHGNLYPRLLAQMSYREFFRASVGYIGSIYTSSDFIRSDPEEALDDALGTVHGPLVSRLHEYGMRPSSYFMRAGPDGTGAFPQHDIPNGLYTMDDLAGVLNASVFPTAPPPDLRIVAEPVTRRNAAGQRVQGITFRRENGAGVFVALDRNVSLNFGWYAISANNMTTFVAGTAPSTMQRPSSVSPPWVSDTTLWTSTSPGRHGGHDLGMAAWITTQNAGGNGLGVRAHGPLYTGQVYDGIAPVPSVSNTTISDGVGGQIDAYDITFDATALLEERGLLRQWDVLRLIKLDSTTPIPTISETRSSVVPKALLGVVVGIDRSGGFPKVHVHVWADGVATDMTVAGWASAQNIILQPVSQGQEWLPGLGSGGRVYKPLTVRLGQRTAWGAEALPDFGAGLAPRMLGLGAPTTLQSRAGVVFGGGPVLSGPPPFLYVQLLTAAHPNGIGNVLVLPPDESDGDVGTGGAPSGGSRDGQRAIGVLPLAPATSGTAPGAPGGTYTLRSTDTFFADFPASAALALDTEVRVRFLDPAGRPAPVLPQHATVQLTAVGHART